MSEWVRGRLHDSSGAPTVGERVDEIARVNGTAVEQILSGRLTVPVDYVQDVDEWVVVLAGRAVLEVEGVRLDLTAGDWVLLPALTPHRLLETDPGTSWLTVTGLAQG
ncbi:MAG: cupin domain-containing protein [Acidimicrobiia bacterium]